MLAWLNGPFGGGKTQTAHELVRRLPDGVVCAPEHECPTRLQDKQFATHVRTDDIPAKEVTNHIATTTSLTLARNTDSRARGYTRRAWTSIKHIRFD